MTTKHIQKLNEAVYILRNFVELSAQLLPFLVELKYLKKPTSEDLEDKENIIDLYRNYQFDDDTSIQLMDSPVLALIHESFDTIVEEKSNKRISMNKVKKFMKEHDRLKHQWMKIDMN
ncbi:MAG: hypothetical protein HYR91_06545 [Flavobacteriia bacterium]|nr:hypothetical protein [Flavobacteriia bacterium]